MEVSVKQDVSLSKETLWKAITDNSHMRKWYFENIPDFKAELGFKTSFKVYSSGKLFTHIWQITDVQPLKKLSYSWQYKEYQGKATIHFIIEETPNGVQLEVLTENFSSFPKDIAEFKYESCLAGWNYFIKERLPAYIEGEDAPF